MEAWGCSNSTLACRLPVFDSGFPSPTRRGYVAGPLALRVGYGELEKLTMVIGRFVAVLLVTASFARAQNVPERPPNFSPETQTFPLWEHASPCLYRFLDVRGGKDVLRGSARRGTVRCSRTPEREHHSLSGEVAREETGLHQPPLAIVNPASLRPGKFPWSAPEASQQGAR